MLAHSISYVIATIFSLTVLILTTIKQSNNLNTETGNRVEIAINIFEILNYIPWFAVQILMLLIFTKFGKPLQDNIEELIRAKMIELFEK